MVKRTKEILEEVDVELPYYYKHDLMIDHTDIVIYGKIEADKITTIKIDTHPGRSDSCEIEVTKESFADRFNSHCYLAKEYVSNEQEYQQALDKLKLMVAVA